jgi:hypothetical protein
MAPRPPALRLTQRLQQLFGLLLLLRLLLPFFDSPLSHLYSDPLRHWENGQRFLHPDIMGSSDPFLYQLWMFLLQRLAHGNDATIQLGCGALCAAMPYGWYRALRELLPRARALTAALLIGLIPESLSMYAFFMNETLLMTLLGYCFWLTLRCRRKGNLAAFALACLGWACAGLTRTVAVPMGFGCLLWLWLTQPRRHASAVVAVLILGALTLPVALRDAGNLGFYSPFGNLYFNTVYHDSGMHDVAVDYGPLGRYEFGSPSFYNPTFYPFSSWTTDRRGTAQISIDTRAGRAPWLRELARVRAARNFPRWRQRWEDLLYLLFGQNWPNSDTGSVLGAATLWGRWLWAPLLLLVLWAVIRRRYRGRQWLLPSCALGTMALLALQSQGVMEARYREPVDAILVAAAILGVRRVAAAAPVVPRSA